MKDPYRAPLWFKIFYGFVTVVLALILIGAITGWDPLRLLGDPL